jgi:biopolymer transport protein ExbB
MMPDGWQQHILSIWTSGGALMVPLFALSLFIYMNLAALLVRTARWNFYKTDPNDWKHWVDRPADGQGEIGRMIHYCHEGISTQADVRARLREIESHYLPHLNRYTNYAFLLVSSAPLLGLLGTVVGMLETFAGLSVSSGGDTVDRVAGGISEALITTQAGLVLAIPGYFMIDVIRNRRAKLRGFFLELEIAILRNLHHQRKAS